MKKITTKMAVLAATSVLALSGMLVAENEAIQVGVGYRQDSIRWKLRDYGAINPSAKSSLSFRDLEIVTLGTKLKGMLGCSAYGRISFDYGWVLDGRLREKIDIYEREEIVRFHNTGLAVEGEYGTVVLKNRDKDDSYVWDLNVAFGAPMDCGCSDWQFAPMVGFSYDRQHLKFANNKEVTITENISEESFNIVVGESSSRRRQSTFLTSFWGPWIGFDLFYNSEGCWNLFGEFELHLGRAERERRSHSGLPFLDDYSSTKNFWGTNFRLGGNYNFCDCWYMEGALSYQYWLSYGCRDRLYWNSGAIRFDLGYMF